MSGLGGRATGESLLGAVVLLCDEPAVPAEDGVGCHDARQVREAAPAEDLAFDRQTAPLVVGEAEPSGTALCAEDAVLLKKVVDGRLLLAVDRAREH